jgi:hypothetical protein
MARMEKENSSSSLIRSYPWLKFFALALFGAAATSQAVDYHFANARQLQNALTLAASAAFVPGFAFKLGQISTGDTANIW